MRCAAGQMLLATAVLELNRTGQHHECSQHRVKRSVEERRHTFKGCSELLLLRQAVHLHLEVCDGQPLGQERGPHHVWSVYDHLNASKLDQWWKRVRARAASTLDGTRLVGTALACCFTGQTTPSSHDNCQSQMGIVGLNELSSRLVQVLHAALDSLRAIWEDLHTARRRTRAVSSTSTMT